MSLPAPYPLELYRGDTARWQFKLWADAYKTDPVDLTGVTVKAEIREAPGGADITELSCSVTTPNIIDMQLSAADAHDLPAAGAWDLQLTWPGGDIQTVLAGKVTVTADVTDSDALLRAVERRRNVLVGPHFTGASALLR